MERNFDAYPVPNGQICEMVTTADYTRFQLWSPEARAVCVWIYEDSEGVHHAQRMWRGSLCYLNYPMAMDPLTGLWAVTVEADLRGKFYAFEVTDARGRKLGQTPGIFAKAVGVNGRVAQVLDLRETDPEGWAQDRRPSLSRPSDAIIYEMHHRDFSADAQSGIRHKGKFLALTEHGALTADGLPSGIDHLVEMGVTHVHLLPSFDFGSVDEAAPHVPQYNWGYDPMNYNVPEGSYSTDARTPAVRIREFKAMVMALHGAGLRVVMDVVYNHVHSLESSPLQRTCPDYFFRWKEEKSHTALHPQGRCRPSNGSGCGNETASERAMMRRFMVESVLHWVREYHVDGFRFDLMGLHDVDTMRAIRDALAAIDPTILVYGEAWTAAAPGLPADRLALKHNMRQLYENGCCVAAFGDELRDALRGPWNNDRRGAFLTGQGKDCAGLQKGIAAAMDWLAHPAQMISYVSCHDDLCLADRIRMTAPMADLEERERLQKLAYTVVLTSRGIPFIWCGDEMMRERQGVRNCYNQPDSVNAISWHLKAEHLGVFDYFCRLIRWRRLHSLCDDSVEFLPIKRKGVVAYVYGQGIMVVLNSCCRDVSLRQLPGVPLTAAWRVALHSDKAPLLTRRQLVVPAQSAVVLTRVAGSALNGGKSFL